MDLICRWCGALLIYDPKHEWYSHPGKIGRISLSETHQGEPVTAEDIERVVDAVNGFGHTIGYEAGKAAVNAYLKGLSHK